jgi:hypothetical protein
MVQLTEIQAHGLAEDENVYVVVEVEQERLETPVTEGQHHYAKWSDELKVKTSVTPGHNSVRVLAYSKQSSGQDTLIGSGAVNLMCGKNHVQLRDASGAATGTVDFCATGAGLKRGNSGAETYEGENVPATTGFAGGGASVHSDAGVGTGRRFDPAVLHEPTGEQPIKTYVAEDVPSVTGVTGGGATAHSDTGVKTGRAYQPPQ